MGSQYQNDFSTEIHFGGPDYPRRLRDVLLERITAVPSGGEIIWVTYYFRDRELARALILARERGVRVYVCLAAKPRTSDANDAVIALLAAEGGLGNGLRVISLPGVPAPRARGWRMQVHEKLYYFSHPQPTAFIGSFNPSGDRPEQRPDIVAEIGDQDRAYNVLVGLTDPNLVGSLLEHARQMHLRPPGIFYRFSSEANRALIGADTTLHFWPRVSPHPLIKFLDQFGHGTRIRLAASHIRASSAVDVMIALAKRGADLEILTEATYRRVTATVEKRIVSAGVCFRRIKHADNIPMHLKFVLVEHGGQRWSLFGSFNWTRPSFWLNHEIAAISSNPNLFTAFAGQWERLEKEIDE